MAYHPYPLTLDPLPHHLRPGLIIISALAITSLVSTTGAASFIVYRICNRKRYQAAPLRYNQSLVLILNLLVADFQQALSFTLSLHWLRKDAILSPTPTCTAQGWLVQIGDVSSGLFSLAIATQTFYIIVLQKNLAYRKFCLGVFGIWIFCVTVSLISPIIHTSEELFVSAGAWCWIWDKYRDERLLVHYLWIFICEFGSIILYAIVFVFLRRNAAYNAPSGVHTRTMHRVARLMLVYPIAYTCLTLPLAAVRMASQSSRRLGDTALIFAGACMASCGWVDVLLYLVTRRTIISLQQHSLGSRGADRSIPLDPNVSLYGNQTVVGRGDHREGSRRRELTASSQEGFVKLEQVVEVVVESAADARSRATASHQTHGQTPAPTYW